MLLLSASRHLARLQFKLDMKFPPRTPVLQSQAPLPARSEHAAPLLPPPLPAEKTKNSNGTYRTEGGGCVEDGVPVAMAMTMQAPTLFFVRLKRSTVIAHRVGRASEP